MKNISSLIDINRWFFFWACFCSFTWTLFDEYSLWIANFALWNLIWCTFDSMLFGWSIKFSGRLVFIHTVHVFIQILICFSFGFIKLIILVSQYIISSFFIRVSPSSSTALHSFTLLLLIPPFIFSLICSFLFLISNFFSSLLFFRSFLFNYLLLLLLLLSNFNLLPLFFCHI
jgi:hypothetical protein